MSNIIKKKKAGISLTELVISALLLSIVMLGAAGFSANFMDVSFRNSKQMVNVNEARAITENIAKEISTAKYIYPAGIDIVLSPSGGSAVTISTNSAVALLFEEEASGGGHSYGFTAFYPAPGSNGGTDLHQFTTAPDYTWDDNTNPATSLLSFSGSSTRIISDVDTSNSSLAYILNYNNGLTDEILRGAISGVATNSPAALIRGIDWQLAQSNVESRTIVIKELSRNVPRFFE